MGECGKWWKATQARGVKTVPLHRGTGWVEDAAKCDPKSASHQCKSGIFPDRYQVVALAVLAKADPQLEEEVTEKY